MSEFARSAQSWILRMGRPDPMSGHADRASGAFPPLFNSNRPAQFQMRVWIEFCSEAGGFVPAVHSREESRKRCMNVSWNQFDADKFSFHRDPVLVIEDFWTDAERQVLLQAGARATWRALSEMPHVRATFPDCGNWGKAEMAQAEARRLLERLSLPCIERYIESFPSIRRRHMSFSYYSYAAGDCLLTHDDTVQTAGPANARQCPAPLRRLALVTYLHDEWQPDWGGRIDHLCERLRRWHERTPTLHYPLHCAAARLVGPVYRPPVPSRMPRGPRGRGV